MSKDIQIFNNDKFGQLRTVIIDNKPWFVGKDVADALGYSNTRDALSKHVENEDKNTVAIRDGKGNPNQTVINASGVYSLVFGSKLESAKEFKHWVTHDVLPATWLEMVNRGNGNTGNWNTGNWNTGNWNTGNHNSGNHNSGDWNAGNCNAGNWNTGNWNTGNWNTGNWNTGNHNSGYHNSGDWNAGNCNAGNWNTGNCNTGNHNSGDWNRGDFSNGCFNTVEQKIHLFNKPSEWTYRDWLDSEAHHLLWQIPVGVLEYRWFENMTVEEKAEHPEAKTTGGYLKELDNSECAVSWWRSLDQNEKNIIMAIPNFNRGIFKEITGIDVDAD